jgi:hypothetical protein
MQQGRHIAYKFESGWEVGVIKAFDKILREGYGKDKYWVLLELLGLPSRDSA